MRRPARSRSVRPQSAEGQARADGGRDRYAVLLALVTVVCLGSVFLLARSTQFLMPGPLASAHGAIEDCGSCHTGSGESNLSWIHGLVAGDPLEDSKACITCHKMPDTAFNPHGAPAEVLNRSTERLTGTAASTPAPLSARVQSIAFPADDVAARGLYCATCHQEHQGATFNLGKISNEQCRSCHVVKFDSFDGHHPEFDNYPFKRRTRIIYDHAGHFGKHYPDFAAKNPDRKVPETCATCHTSRADKRLMAVAPFEETCTACHLDQILGKERVSGPKGIAFLTLPGLDLQTLKERNAPIGEWPETSDAELTPFMKVMIGRSERGRALINALNDVDLQDLAGASDGQILAVTELAWEIKGLFHALISGKASDVLADLDIGGGARLSAGLVADLTASIPRDVIVNAHLQWLPSLGAEMADRPVAGDGEQSGWSAAISETRLAGSASRQELSGVEVRQAFPRFGQQAFDSDAGGAENAARLAQANQQTRTKNTPSVVIEKRARIDAAGRVEPEPQGEAETVQPAAAQPPASRSEGAPGSAGVANAGPDGGAEAAPAEIRPQNRAADQTDDLLYPTEEELRAEGITDDGGFKPEGGAPIAASSGDASNDNAAVSALPGAEAPAGPDAVEAEPQIRAAPVISIESDVDPESWAEYGGWYRQDYAIYYRPDGHKDKFIYSWLFLTGPQAPKDGSSPAAAVFESLIGKDAQGSCTKCHSVDDIRGGGRLVNFSPPKVETKQGRFTDFIHEPHFGILENRGCLTCHDLEQGRPYLTSYEQGDSQNFASNFGEVKKDLCQSCHTDGMARQDCLLCHKYHVDGVITPIMSTKIPIQ